MIVEVPIITTTEEIKELEKELSTEISFGEFVESGFIADDNELDSVADVDFVYRRQIYQEVELYLKVLEDIREKDPTFSPYFHKHVFEGDSEAPLLYAFKVDPLLFWRKHREQFPFLFKLARRLLAGSPSSTCIERVFSVVTNLYGKKRGNLSPDYMEDFMLAKLNKGSAIPMDKAIVSKTVFTNNNGGKDHVLWDEDMLQAKFRYNQGPSSKRAKLSYK